MPKIDRVISSKINERFCQQIISPAVKKQLLEKYNASEIIKITNDVYWMKDKEFWNINNFVNNKWELLFNVVGVIKDLWVIKYKKLLEQLWYKWYVDDNWYYHIISIKTWKEISQESLKYYEIFDTLAKIKDRLDVVGTIFDGDNMNKNTPEWSKKEFWLTLLKEANKILVARWIKSWVIKPFEVNYLYYQKQLSEQEAKKYLKQTLTFEYLSNLINNKAIDLVWEQGSIPVTLDWKTYKILFWPVTKDELDYYKAKNWINDKMYKELLKILEEHKKLKEQQDQEKKKHTEETKEKISNLENDITKK